MKVDPRKFDDLVALCFVAGFVIVAAAAVISFERRLAEAVIVVAYSVWVTLAYYLLSDLLKLYGKNLQSQRRSAMPAIVAFWLCSMGLVGATVAVVVSKDIKLEVIFLVALLMILLLLFAALREWLKSNAGSESFEQRLGSSHMDDILLRYRLLWTLIAAHAALLMFIAMAKAESTSSELGFALLFMASLVAAALLWTNDALLTRRSLIVGLNGLGVALGIVVVWVIASVRSSFSNGFLPALIIIAGVMLAVYAAVNLFIIYMQPRQDSD